MSKLHLGDCMDVMRSMPDSSIDAIVTDPPYGLAFMGAKWDSFGGSTGRQTVGERQAEWRRYADENKGAPRYANSHGKKVTRSEMESFQFAMTPIFGEALRVAKPGAYLLCFGGTRTFHRIACAIEDAGWTVRDCIMWVYGQGFPHGMDVAKAIDKALGAERKKVFNTSNAKPNAQDTGRYGAYGPTDYIQPEPATDQAKEWEGWNTALKPAWEPIIVAQKPVEGTIAANVLKWGTGAMNIDACRVPTDDKLGGGMRGGSATGQFDRPWMHDEQMQAAFVERKKANVAKAEQKGRYPANLVHDGSQMVLDLFPQSKGQQGDVTGNEPSRTGDNGIYGHYGPRSECIARNDFGSAARFFYCAKASKKDRGEGNNHPTVKPTALMEWLVKLVTPEGATVLDPFMGSGTTGVACANLGRRFVGIEREWEYMRIAGPRIADREREFGTYEPA